MQRLYCSSAGHQGADDGALVGVHSRDSPHGHAFTESAVSAARNQKANAAITATTTPLPVSSLSRIVSFRKFTSSRRAGQLSPCAQFPVQGGQRFISSMVDSPFMRSARSCRWCIALQRLADLLFHAIKRGLIFAQRAVAQLDLVSLDGGLEGL